MSAPAAVIERISTQDGASISIKRYPVADAPPVILIHGLAVNADIWDIPDFASAEFPFRSLSSLLRDAGFDQWLVNLRGHGQPHMPSVPPPTQLDWCLDDFVLHDLPAVFDHVAAATGRRPLVVTQSMGAMAFAAFLEGATLRRCADRIDAIVLDDEVAQRRNDQILGAVFGEFPAALRWPEALFDDGGSLNWSAFWKYVLSSAPAANVPFEALSRLAWLEAMIAARGNVSLDFLRGDLSRIPGWSSLPATVKSWLGGVEKAAMLKLFQIGGAFSGSMPERAAVLFRARERVFAPMKAGVLRQLGKSVRMGGFISDLGLDARGGEQRAGEPAACVYSEHYDRIRVPALIIAGERDRIANAEVTRRVFFDRIGSADREFRQYAISHGELTSTPSATREIYPGIVAWLAERALDSGRIR